MKIERRGSGIEEDRHRRFLRGAFWISLYLLLVLAPLLLVLFGPAPPAPRPFWIEFSVGLGFVGMAILGVQFLLTARFRRAAAPYGLDIIYHFHRQMAIVAFFLVLAHPLVLVLATPAGWGLLDPRDAEWRVLAGMAAVLALLAILVTTLWRIALRLEYETWRIVHGTLAVVVIAAGMAHIIGVGYYVGERGVRALWIGMTAVWLAMIGYVRLWKPVRMLLEPYAVAEVSEERGSAWTVALTPIGHGGIRFQPGQFAWLTVMNSPFAIREHPFSFSSSAEHPETLAFTIKELGDLTSRIGSLRPGDSAYLDGPYGLFSPDAHDAPGYVFLVGGIGITPVMSMLRTFADRRDERPLLLVYANPEWEDVTFREPIEELREVLDLDVVHVLEKPPEGWDGERGFVTTEILERHLPPRRSRLRYFICGPEPMLESVEASLRELRVPLGRVHVERFNLV